MATSFSFFARQFVTRPPLAALLIVLLPALAAAPEPVKSFDLLNTRLKRGDTVCVADARGLEVSGKTRDLSPASLLLDAGGTPRDFSETSVPAQDISAAGPYIEFVTRNGRTS